jgi:hypothetical protein
MKKAKKKFVSTQEALNLMRKNGFSVQDFIDAVTSGKIKPFKDDGSPMDMEDIETALSAIEKARKAH